MWGVIIQPPEDQDRTALEEMRSLSSSCGQDTLIHQVPGCRLLNSEFIPVTSPVLKTALSLWTLFLKVYFQNRWYSQLGRYYTQDLSEFFKRANFHTKNVFIYFQLKHSKTNVYIYWRFYRLPDWLFCDYRVLEYFRLRAKIILDYFVFTQSLCVGNLFIWSNSKTL